MTIVMKWGNKGIQLCGGGGHFSKAEPVMVEP